MTSFGWAIVGLGKHARNWVAPAILASATSEIVAVVSRDIGRASRVSASWGKPTVYGELAGALADPRVDGVWLVTPNHLHRGEVEACAAAGKHVLCEKPLAVSLADCAAMVEAADLAGIQLGVGFHLRHNLVHEHARDVVRSGQLGELTFVSVRYAHRTAPEAATLTRAGTDDPDPIPTGPAAWRKDAALSGGGAFMGNGVHTIDLMRYLTGSEISNVDARADTADGLETNLIATVALDSGALGFLHAGDIAYPVNEVVINGTEGTIHCTDSIGNAGSGSLDLVTASGTSTFTPPRHDVYVRECDDFVERASERREPNASGVDGLRSALVVDAIYEARAVGERVDVRKASAHIERTTP